MMINWDTIVADYFGKLWPRVLTPGATKVHELSRLLEMQLPEPLVPGGYSYLGHNLYALGGQEGGLIAALILVLKPASYHLVSDKLAEINVRQFMGLYFPNYSKVTFAASRGPVELLKTESGERVRRYGGLVDIAFRESLGGRWYEQMPLSRIELRLEDPSKFSAGYLPFFNDKVYRRWGCLRQK